MSLTLRLARRNLTRNLRRTMLAGSFIALSLAALMLSDGFMRGMTDVMLRGATHTFSGEAQIHAAGYLDEPEVETLIQSPAVLLSELAGRSEIGALAPRVMSPAMLGSSANVLGVQLFGVDPQAELNVSKLKQAVIAGNYLGEGNNRSTDILLGSKLAERLEVGLGDRVVLSASMADSAELNQQLYRVSGLVQFNNRGMDEGMVFLPLANSQELLGIGEGIHQIAIQMSNSQLATVPDLPLWGEMMSLGLDARGWPLLFPELASILQMTDYGLLIGGSILFILAGLGVINTMFMSIYERSYEFGVLRSIGTRATSLGKLILIEAFLLGLFSVIAGLIIGGGAEYLLSINGIQYGAEVEFNGIALHEPIYPMITLSQFTELPLWVLLMTMVACLYPALHAMRIVPAKALHKSL